MKTTISSTTTINKVTANRIIVPLGAADISLKYTYEDWLKYKKYERIKQMLNDKNNKTK